LACQDTVTALPLASLVADTPDGVCGFTPSAKGTDDDVPERLPVPGSSSVAIAHSWYEPFHARLGVPENVQSGWLDDGGVTVAGDEKGVWPSCEAKICTDVIRPPAAVPVMVPSTLGVLVVVSGFGAGVAILTNGGPDGGGGEPALAGVAAMTKPPAPLARPATAAAAARASRVRPITPPWPGRPSSRP
jgi:hypothetical protein